MGSLYFNRAAVAQCLGFLSPRHSSTNGNLTAACSGRANKLASHYQSLVRAADAGRSAARYYDYGNYAFRPRDRGFWSGAKLRCRKLTLRQQEIQPIHKPCSTIALGIDVIFIRLLILVTLLLVISCVALAAVQRRSPAVNVMGRISGTVVDVNESRIAGATVIIERIGFSRAIHTDEDGAYDVGLPTGIYRMKVSSTGFCPIRRAAFKVMPSTVIKFDFTLIVCPIVNNISILDGQYKGETDDYTPPFAEDLLAIDTLALPQPSLLIQFGERALVGNIIQYRGFKSDDKYIGVMASYNLMTLYADKLSFDKEVGLIKAEGNVILEDGKQQVRARRVEIVFKAGEPIIKLER
jgi:hypothetical protein